MTAAAAAVAKVDALLMLMMPSREWIGQSAAAAEAASAAADALKSLSILKAQCACFRSVKENAMLGAANNTKLDQDHDHDHHQQQHQLQQQQQQQQEQLLLQQQQPD